MLRSVFVALALLLSAVPVTGPVHATSAILRCQSPDGTFVYTDKACSALGAKSAPIPGDLLTRIYHDESRYADADDALPAALPAAARRDPSRGCARTTTQLAMDLRASLALGDVNRVAESYHWVGMSSRQGERTLDRLQALTGRPVLDSHYFDARIGAGTLDGTDAAVLASNADIGGDAGMLQLILGSAGDTSRSAVDFDVHHYAGCYFVTF
ncbi:MAG: hypothetical protein ACJ8GK_02680 [Luteimonas sp.]